MGKKGTSVKSGTKSKILWVMAENVNEYPKKDHFLWPEKSPCTRVKTDFDVIKNHNTDKVPNPVTVIIPPIANREIINPERLLKTTLVK